MGKQYRQDALSSEQLVGFFGVVDLAHVLMFLMRNSGDPDSNHVNTSGSVKESDKHNLNVNAVRKSDKTILVRKQVNKVNRNVMAESVERRVLTKRNSDTAYVTKTQSLG